MKYIVYRKLANSYKLFVEKYCLRKRPKDSHCEKMDITKEAECMWREKNMNSNKDLVEDFFKVSEYPFKQNKKLLKKT